VNNDLFKFDWFWLIFCYDIILSYSLWNHDHTNIFWPV